MTVIKRMAMVGYTPRQMFELVINIPLITPAFSCHGVNQQSFCIRRLSIEASNEISCRVSIKV